jgi:ATP-binding cassette subfamily B protein
LILAALVSATAGALEAVTAYILGQVIDGVATAQGGMVLTSSNIFTIAGTVVFFLMLRPTAFGLSALFNNMVVQGNVNALVLSRLHRWTLGQSVGYFDDDFAGRIAQKQMQTARAITDVVAETINVVAFALASMVGSLALLIAIDWRVSVLFLIWLVAYFGLISMFLPRVRQRARERAAARAAVSGQIVDTVTNIKTVKLFAHSDHEDKAALGAMSKYREHAISYGWLAANFRFWLMFLAGVLPVLLLGATVMLWQWGQASQGDIAAAGTVAIRIAQMTGWVSFTLMILYSNIGEAEDGMMTLTARDRLEDAPNARPLTVPVGEVKFEKVSFSYGREIGGVRAVDLTIHAGEKLGIVGASGAGKSTLVALLLRLYDSESGRVLIDDQDITDVTQDSVRRQIAMVTQETAMFNRSARENILYGNPLATDDQMISAAKQAEAHDFILNLQDHKGRTGYDAHLGERGVKLSGGQRQRIALARAIVKDAPILVLDEATSALDSEVEAAIQTALGRVMDGKTVLAIAHRLSTLSEMDRIVVLEQGQVLEIGSHAELLALDGLYAGYWRRQSGGFIRTDATATQ